ncbi:hypothetical protein WJX84_002507 [Apatococcus fuscideae]|uniref:Uncharacterized protein n=1 Tax=Apatococcus fuscideae TaxID=2026836 RepID=A0AAW1SYF7_9CHLO
MQHGYSHKSLCSTLLACWQSLDAWLAAGRSRGFGAYLLTDRGIIILGPSPDKASGGLSCAFINDGHLATGQIPRGLSIWDVSSLPQASLLCKIQEPYASGLDEAQASHIHIPNLFFHPPHPGRAPWASTSPPGSAAERYAGLSSGSSQETDACGRPEEDEGGDACEDTCESRAPDMAAFPAESLRSQDFQHPNEGHSQLALAPGFLARMSPQRHGVAVSMAVPSPSRLGRPPLTMAKSFDEKTLQPIRETEEGRGNLRAALTGMQAELDALSSTWTSLKDPWPVRRAAADEKVHHCWFIEDLR